MLAQGQPGPVATTQSLTPGVSIPLRQGNMGELIKSDLHGKDYEAAYRGTMFGACAQAALATSAGNVVAYTGMCLSNPMGSGKNLVMRKVGLGAILAQTTPLAVGLMVGTSATAVVHTTPALVQNALIGGPAGVGLVDTSATLPVAGTFHTSLGSFGTGATTVDQFDGTFVDLDGSIIIPPGGYCALFTNAASVAASLLPSFKWEEVPQ